MLNRVLVPIDGSDNSIEALQWALKMVEGNSQAELVILNSQPSFQTLHTKRFFSQQDLDEYQQLLFEECVGEARKILEGQSLPYTLELAVGDPKEAIINRVTASKETDQPIDMIVMGTRGLSAIRAALGGVSYGVIQSGVCPVTLVPKQD